jgi:hypothetical protein
VAVTIFINLRGICHRFLFAPEARFPGISGHIYNQREVSGNCYQGDNNYVSCIFAEVMNSYKVLGAVQ